MSLASSEIPQLGCVWTPSGNRSHVVKLKAEVDEYFDLGLRLHPGDVVMDVGANVGMFVLAAAVRCPGVRIFAFEPIPALFEALKKNTASEVCAGSQIELFQTGVAASEHEREAVFFFFRHFPSDSTRYIAEKREETHRIFDHKVERWRRSSRRTPAFVHRAVARIVSASVRGRLGRRVADMVAGVEQVRCKLTTLSRVIDEQALSRIDAIKIDVEGAELDVLRSIRPEHWGRVAQVVVEGHDANGSLEQVERILRENGLSAHSRTTPRCAEENGLNNYLLLAVRP